MATKGSELQCTPSPKHLANHSRSGSRGKWLLLTLPLTSHTTGRPAYFSSFQPLLQRPPDFQIRPQIQGLRSSATLKIWETAAGDRQEKEEFLIPLVFSSAALRKSEICQHFHTVCCVSVLLICMRLRFAATHPLPNPYSPGDLNSARLLAAFQPHAHRIATHLMVSVWQH